MPNRFSRRDLLTATGSALTAALLAACSTNQSTQVPITPSLQPQARADTPTPLMSTPASAEAPDISAPNQSAAAATAFFERQPYLQATTATGTTISWKLQENQASWLRIGPAGGTLRQINTERGKQADITVSDLQPNTKYQYEVGVGDTALTPRYSFYTAPNADATAFSFLAFGDSGEGNAVQTDLAAYMQTLKPDMIIHVGDFVYGKDGDIDNRYFGVYTEMIASTTVFPAIGDNEIEDDKGKAFRKAFLLPPNAPPNGKTHAYAFDYGPAHFIALDTETQFDAGSPQYAWLADDLARTQQPWKFVYFHRPVHSIGEDRQNSSLRNAWCPLFEKYAVTAVFSGHDHNYQRTEPIREFTSGTGGVVYIITGGGGADLRPVEEAGEAVVAEAANHIVQVQIDGDTATLRALLADGSVLDEAMLQRNSG